MSQTGTFTSISTDTLYVLVPKIASGVASLFLQLYIIRHVDPAEYGAFGLCLTCLIFFESFVGSAFDLGLLREAPLLRTDGGPRLSTLERSAMLLKLLVGTGLLIPAAYCGEWFGMLIFQQPHHADAFVAVVLAGTAILVLRSVQLSFQISQNFKLVGAVDLTHTCLRIVLVCGLIAAGYTSPTVLLSAYALAAVLVMLGFGFPLFKEFVSTSWYNLTECKKLMQYGGGVLLVGAFSLGLSSIDKFALAVLSTPIDVGLYQAGLTIALLPELVGTCLAQVLSPRITAYCQAGIFANFFMKLQRGMFVVSGIILIAGILLTKPVVSLLFPDRYGAAIDIIVILLPAGIAGLLAFPVAVSFLAFFSLRTLFLIDCLMAPFLVIAYYYAARDGGAIAVAWVTVVARCGKALAQHLLTIRLARRMDIRCRDMSTSESRSYGQPSVPQSSVSA